MAMVALLVCLASSAASAQRVEVDGKVCLFGTLHAHTSLSGDVSPPEGEDWSPLAAFRYAREHGLDFLGVSDHHKAVDGGGAARFRLDPDDYVEQLFDVAMAFNDTHEGDFVAIPGIEWGTIGTGNHVNLFGMDELPPDTILDAEYDELLEWAGDSAAFAQFNHPKSWKNERHRNRDVGNYGRGLFESEADFAAAADRSVTNLSVLCTVFGGHLRGLHRRSEEKTHREFGFEDQYREHLAMGLHLSPVANQDTHGPNWGTVTAGRTAVWADSVAYDDVIEAFRANRVFATEDDELAVAFRARVDGEVFWMGDVVVLGAEQADVELMVRIDQVPGVDGDDTDEGGYTVEIMSGIAGEGGHEAEVWFTLEGMPAGMDFGLTVPVVEGEHVYLRVTEENGSDNPVPDDPGRHDVRNNTTGVRHPDGLRDDMNDTVITTPIWFVRDA